MKIHASIGLAILSLLAGCAGTPAPQTSVGPSQSTGLPYGVNDRELETPNSLPPGFTTSNPFAPETGVVGVTHAAP